MELILLVWFAFFVACGMLLCVATLAQVPFASCLPPKLSPFWASMAGLQKAIVCMLLWLVAGVNDWSDPVWNRGFLWRKHF